MSCASRRRVGLMSPSRILAMLCSINFLASQDSIDASSGRWVAWTLLARGGPSGDRRQVLRSQQGYERAAVHDRQAALAQLDAGAGKAGDLAGEVGLVTDQQRVPAAGAERERVEWAA